MLHIVTPSSRPYNLPILYMNLKQARLGAEFRWEICMYQDQYDTVPQWITDGLKEGGWVTFHIYDKKDAADHCYYKINTHVTAALCQDDYYLVFPDDQLLPVSTIQLLPPILQPKQYMAVMITGILGTGVTLLAEAANMRVSRVDLAQMVVKGEVFTRNLFNIRSCVADGEFARYLINSERPLMYLPACVTLYNALQPKRWSLEELKVCFDGIHASLPSIG